MTIKLMIGAFAAAALTATPVLAAPARNGPTSASALSISNVQRAAKPVGEAERLTQPGAIVGLVLGAAIIAGGVIIALDDDDDGPTSP